MLTNADIAELLARAAEEAKQPLQRALRRASRRAFLWPVEVEEIFRKGEDLTELSGPYLIRPIKQWLRNPPERVEPPELRRGFLTLAAAQATRKKNKGLFQAIRGDLQMHTVWSDGSASIQEMAEAAANRGYAYIAVTDHAKGLKIAGGIDEVQLRRQEDEIGTVNAAMRERGFRVLRSIELSLSRMAQATWTPAP